MVADISQTTAVALFAGGGDIGERLRWVDWEQTAFGPVEAWSQSLRTTVQICLGAHLPMAIWWISVSKGSSSPFVPKATLDIICNDAYHANLGLTRLSDRGYLPQVCEQPSEMRSALEQVLSTGKTTHSGYQAQISHWPSSEIGSSTASELGCFKLSYSPLFDNSDRVRGVFVTAVETTAQKRVEQISAQLQAKVQQCEVALEQTAKTAQRQINNVLENISDAFIAFDQEWCYTYVNKKAAQLLRQDADALIGRSVWKDASPQLGGRAYQELHRAVEENVPVIFEDYSPSFDTWFEVHGYPSAEGLAIYFQDVSDRKRIEAEREERLAKEQAAREAAEAASRLKDEFLAVVSHELRSPLNPILGCAKLLKRGGLTPERKNQALSSIERNAQMQAQLINDLLDVSQILRGELNLNICAVPAVAAVREAIKKVESDAAHKNILIETHFCPLVSSVLADPSRLQQIVWNLLSNAIKFTPRAGNIDVRAEQVNNQVEISITDTGKGIKESFLPHVFDRFRQEDAATTRQFGGLGLGLAIVKHLVELHNGAVEASSPGEDRGATFTVYLPLSDTPEKAARNAARRRVLNG